MNIWRTKYGSHILSRPDQIWQLNLVLKKMLATLGTIYGREGQNMAANFIQGDRIWQPYFTFCLNQVQQPHGQNTTGCVTGMVVP